MPSGKIFAVVESFLVGPKEKGKAKGDMDDDANDGRAVSATDLVPNMAPILLLPIPGRDNNEDPPS